MYDLERSIETVAQSAARALMQARLGDLRYDHPCPQDIHDAIVAITYGQEHGKHLQYLLDTHRRTGVHVTIEYGYNHNEGCMRLGLIHRRLSGIPYDKLWWTGDPHNLLAY